MIRAETTQSGRSHDSMLHLRQSLHLIYTMGRGCLHPDRRETYRLRSVLEAYSTNILEKSTTPIRATGSTSAILSLCPADNAIIRPRTMAMALTTSVASMFALVLTILVFNQFGIRVGGRVSLAMSKVTVTSLLFSAIMGGMILGVGFTKYRSKIQIQPPYRIQFMDFIRA